eukprot:c7074_g1_i2.p1 GENE.c7074_g1_i2~~c7074_g1_i2.p1  ORF type:complete len:828 (-),score=249.34 c7074_g1_i2:120-2603(-)
MWFRYDDRSVHKTRSHNFAWDQIQSFNEKASRYEDFVTKLCREQRYVKLIQRLVMSPEYAEDTEIIAFCIANISFDLNYSFPLLQAFVDENLEESNGSHIDQVFPTYSLATRLFASFAFKLSSILLELTFADYFKPLTLEEQSMEKCVESIEQCVEKILTDEIILRSIPRRVRTICYAIDIKCKTVPKKFTPETRVQLIAGLLLLYVFLPALDDPKFYRLITTYKQTSVVASRNIHLLKETISNLGRNTRFAESSISLLLNNILEKLTNLLPTWVKSVITDPEKADEIPAWCEVFETKFPSEVNFRDFFCIDFTKLHLAVLRFAKNSLVGPRVSPRYQVTNGRQDNAATLTELISVLRESPMRENAPFATEQSLSSPMRSITRGISLLPSTLVSNHFSTSQISRSKSALASPTQTPKHPHELIWTFDVRQENPQQGDVGQEENYFYPGPKLKDGTLVFFFIVWRLNTNLVFDIQRFEEEISKIIQQSLNQTKDQGAKHNIDIIVDFSYSYLPSQIALSLLMKLPSFHSVFSQKMWVDYIRNIYIIHPSELYYGLKNCLTTMMPEISGMLIETRNWKYVRDQLSQQKNFGLPDECLYFIPGSHFIIKNDSENSTLISNKRRAIKISRNSIIEFHKRAVHREVRLNQIEKIFQDNKGIILEFSQNANSHDQSKVWQLQFVSVYFADMFINDLMQSIVESSRRGQMNRPCSFPVNKVNKLGKKQDRTIYVFSDCVVNTNVQSVHNVFSFTDVTYVKTDAISHLLEFQLGENHYAFASENLDELSRLVREGVAANHELHQKFLERLKSEMKQICIHELIRMDTTRRTQNDD